MTDFVIASAPRSAPARGALAAALAVLGGCAGEVGLSNEAAAPGAPAAGGGERRPAGGGAASGAGPAVPSGGGAPPDPGAGPGAGDPVPVPPSACGDPGPTPLRRLSHAEYRNTVRDLFRGRVAPAALELPREETGAGFDNDESALQASPLVVEGYEAAAFRVAAAAVADARELLAGAPGCPPADAAGERACGRAFIERFGARAFRRPLEPGEVDELARLFEAERAKIDFAGALQLTVAAILQSAEFLYRVELSGPGAAAPRAPITAWEFATRLSYLVWQTMPDDALFEAARSGRLATESGILAEVQRMLADPRARPALVDFHRQWLGWDALAPDAAKDPRLFPTWRAGLVAALREEPARFVADVIIDRRGTFADLMTSPRTWVNPALAALYGVPAPASGWQAVTLPDAERAGFFTRGAFLAAHADEVSPSPPLRGNAIFERAFCNRLPPPPPDIDATPPRARPGAARTNRQLFEEKSGQPACAPCHRIINGFGYGLESYDAAGRFRRIDNGLPVDARSELVGTDVDGPYDGPLELARRLSGSRQARRCLVLAWLRFALGRAPHASDECRASALLEALAQGQDRFVELVARTATGPELRLRAVAP